MHNLNLFFCVLCFVCMPLLLLIAPLPNDGWGKWWIVIILIIANIFITILNPSSIFCSFILLFFITVGSCAINPIIAPYQFTQSSEHLLSSTDCSNFTFGFSFLNNKTKKRGAGKHLCYHQILLCLLPVFCWWLPPLPLLMQIRTGISFFIANTW